MLKLPKYSDTKLLSLSRGFSETGSSLSQFFIPMFIYKVTESAFLMAVQVAIMCLGNFLACYFVAKNCISGNDKQVSIASDILAASLILIPVFIPTGYLAISLYFCSFVSAFLSTITKGYHESLVGSICEKERLDSRQNIVSNIKVHSHLGSLIGYGLAGVVFVNLNYRAAFLVDAFTYLLSSAILMRLTVSGVIVKKSSSSKSGVAAIWSTLFGFNLRGLSISHATAAVGLGLFNSTAIYILKGELGASATEISAYYIIQFICSLIGSMAVLRFTSTNTVAIENGWKIRTLYCLPFLFLSLFPENVTGFILWTGLLALIHGFSVPVWLDFFQSNSGRESWKIVGSGRKMMVSLVGAISGVIFGLSIESIGYRLTYLLGTVLFILSASILMMYGKRRSSLKENAHVGV